MKTKLLLVTFLLTSALYTYSQSKFVIESGIGEQFVKNDRGEFYEGSLNYKISNRIYICLDATQAKLKNSDLNLSYELNKYAFHVNYGFSNSDNSAIESVLGFSYVHFDKNLNLPKNDGLGIDLGAKSTFGLKHKLNYGFKLVNTYSSISPGGIYNASIFFKYNL